ncbi:MAG TPA: hypothetical protein PLS31_08645, partial [Candidatus Sumerlaeota bacterium]|nr:hypothetical protein [Candidatus Sumerlaeota bacterium]
MKYLWNGADKAWLPKNPAAASAQEHFRIKISVTANAVTDSGTCFSESALRKPNSTRNDNPAQQEASP